MSQRHRGRYVRGGLVLVTAVSIGALIGVGMFTFQYARGSSYMTDDPAACANCHVMQQQYDAWRKSTHHAVAVCNDCHTPHHFFGKYYTKARNGYHHSLAFTTGRFHEPIQITPLNRAVTQDACRECHADVVQSIDRFHVGEDRLDCIRCHRDVGHPGT